jgi:hypothetical protein
MKKAEWVFWGWGVENEDIPKGRVNFRECTGDLFSKKGHCGKTLENARNKEEYDSIRLNGWCLDCIEARQMDKRVYYLRRPTKGKYKGKLFLSFKWVNKRDRRKWLRKHLNYPFITVSGIEIPIPFVELLENEAWGFGRTQTMFKMVLEGKWNEWFIKHLKVLKKRNPEGYCSLIKYHITPIENFTKGRLNEKR